MKIISAILTIPFLLFSANIHAAEIISSSAEYKNNRFIIKVVGVVEPSPEHVFGVLTDYENITKISPKIIESKIIKIDGDTTIVKTVAKGCVWFFCKEIVNTQSTTSVFEQHIQSLTIPSKSNLKFGKMVWNIKDVPFGTQIDYYAEIEPDFFVPPLIGAYFIKNSMLAEAKAFIDSVEKLSDQDTD
ncbi:MAG: SRPBCC family protein [Pseudomonadota bacterium]